MTNYRPLIARASASGFSLVEVLVVAAIMSIMALVGAQILVGQVNDQKRVQQKAEINDLKTTMAVVMNNSANCACQFVGKSFSYQSGTNVKLSNITALNYSCQAGATNIATINGLVPGTQTHLMVNSISIVNISPTGNLNEYNGLLQIGFDPTSTVSIFAPASTPIIMETDGVVGNTKILTCGTSSVAAASPQPNPNTPTCVGKPVPPDDFGQQSGYCGQNAAGAYDPSNPTALPGDGCAGRIGNYVCTGSGNWVCMGAQSYACGGGGGDDGG